MNLLIGITNKINENEMEELFLNKDLSLLAKEKGFNKACLAYYRNDAIRLDGHPYEYITPSSYEEVKNDSHMNTVFAPLYQQIIDWFLLEKKINVELNYLPNIEKWSYVVLPMHLKGMERFKAFAKLNPENFNNPQEARIKMIEEAFKLI